MYPKQLFRIRRLLESIFFAFLIQLTFIFPNGCYGKANLLSKAHGAKILSANPNADASASNLWPHETSDLAPDPALHFGSLPNGFRYVLMKNQEPKGRVSMHLNVQIGSAQEEDEEQGLAHFMEHMLFDGSTHYKPGELVKYFQKIGMQFGPDANAHTSFYETVYDILLPKGDLKSIEEALVVFKDFAEGALLLDSEVERERWVVLAEKRERDSESYRTYVRTSEFEFPDSVLSKRFPIGREDVIRKSDRSRIKRFYDRWYRPEKMILVMVGDFDNQAAVSMIAKHFADVVSRSGKPEEPGIGEIRHTGVKPFYHFEKEAGNTEVAIEVIQKVPKRPDTKASRLAMWKKEVAHRIIQDRIDAILAAPGPFFSLADIDGGLFLKEIEYAQIRAECRPDQWEKALVVLEQTLRRALNFGFTESELNRVKKEIAAGMDSAVKGSATRNSRNLARKLVASLNDDEVFLSPEQIKVIFGDAIAALTPEEVHDALKAAWGADHRLILVTGNANLSGETDGPEARIRTVYEESRKIPVEKPVSTETIRFPYLPEPDQTGKILRRTEIPDLGIIRVDFENGVRLNLKKTDFSDNEVQASLVFGPGKSDEPADRPGIGLLAEAIINESGVGGLNRHELDQALSGSNTGVAFRIADGHFTLNGTSVTGEVQLLFQLMATHLKDPAYREEAYRLTLERFRQLYEEMGHSVEDTMRFFGSRFLAGDDGRFGYPVWEQFSRIRLEEVQNWISVFFKQAELELSVVGDIDIDTVISLASRYFGSLTPRSGIMRVRPVAGIRFPAGESRTFEVDTRIPKALVVVAYPTEDIWEIGRSRRLNILGEVLSERIREAIREKLGAAYSPVAYHHPSRTYAGYGILLTMAYADPAAINPLISEIQSTITGLAQRTITAEEFQRAKDPIKTGIKDMMRKNTYWLDTVLIDSRVHPVQLEWSRTILSDYDSITPEEVSGLAGTYLKKDQAAVMVFKPKSAP